jgi:hypothetical protein
MQRLPRLENHCRRGYSSVTEGERSLERIAGRSEREKEEVNSEVNEEEKETERTSSCSLLQCTHRP